MASERRNSLTSPIQDLLHDDDDDDDVFRLLLSVAWPSSHAPTPSPRSHCPKGTELWILDCICAAPARGKWDAIFFFFK